MTQPSPPTGSCRGQKKFTFTRGKVESAHPGLTGQRGGGSFARLFYRGLLLLLNELAFERLCRCERFARQSLVRLASEIASGFLHR